jgi:hypothetical protein
VKVEAGSRGVKTDTDLKSVGWRREKLVAVKMMQSRAEGKTAKIKTTVIGIT